MHADIGTTVNIYAGTMRNLKKKEFSSFSEYMDA